MTVVKKGDKIHILCEAKLEDGTPCLKIKEENKIELVVGEGKVFPALENALKDMKERETKNLTLEPEEAFGPHIDELVMEVPKNAFRTKENLNIGSKVKIDSPTGKTYYGYIAEINEEIIILDLNHPLAGKRLEFSVTVVSIDES